MRVMQVKVKDQGKRKNSQNPHPENRRVRQPLTPEVSAGLRCASRPCAYLIC